MTCVYLALSQGAYPTQNRGLRSFCAAGRRVSLLSSFATTVEYMRQIEQDPAIHLNNWYLDCGAYSAWNVGKVIDIDEYIGHCHNTTATDVAALDVIGDPEAGMKNAEYMWSHGIAAIPCYHFGEPVEVIEWIRDCSASKVAVSTSGVTYPMDQNLKFLEMFFSMVWPRKIHGYALVRRTYLKAYPFHSVDSSSWESGPLRFGSYKHPHGANMHSSSYLGGRGGNGDLCTQIEAYTRMSKYYGFVWRRELAQL